MTQIATHHHQELHLVLRRTAASPMARLLRRPAVQGALGAIVTFLVLMAVLPLLIGPDTVESVENLSEVISTIEQPEADGLGYNPHAPAVPADS